MIGENCYDCQSVDETRATLLGITGAGRHLRRIAFHAVLGSDSAPIATLVERAPVTPSEAADLIARGLIASLPFRAGRRSFDVPQEKGAGG